MIYEGASVDHFVNARVQLNKQFMEAVIRHLEAYNIKEVIVSVVLSLVLVFV